MNFLAHLFLSGDDENIMIGNFIADDVKGSHFAINSSLTPLQMRGGLNNEGIIKGIKLHRLIDAFTDSHPVVEESKKRLRPYFHKYSPVIADVFYDHFLAKNWSEYHSAALEKYVNDVYSLLKKSENILPAKTKNMLNYMIKFNWLEDYATLEGINRALTGMSRRATFESKMELATGFLEKDYLLYHNEFNSFFPELITYCTLKLKSV